MEIHLLTKNRKDGAQEGPVEIINWYGVQEFQ